MLMLAKKLFQSWIRLQNLNLVILSGLGPPKYALDTFTPFVYILEGNQDFFRTYIAIVLHYHFVCMSWARTNGFLVLSYFMNNILSSREFIVLFRVYGFLAWWYWLCTSSWPSRSEFMPSCNFHKTSHKWYNILFLALLPYTAVGKSLSNKNTEPWKVFNEFESCH